uniref:Uncharacterized protein n=1 Tax=Avena sativa TaxID=4498 RepID=A0ACD6AAM0_AVESA
MDREATTSHDVLENMLLDESAEPIQLTLSLLEDITNRFSFDLQIGRGGFAVVYKGIVGKGLVAVKKLSNTFCIPEKKFHEEVKCLIKAKHKNIVRFLGYCAETQGIVEEIEGNFVMADQRNWLLCFEYVCNGSLDRHITDATRGLNWRFRYRIIRGICEGLLFLHEKHILHLDLKPANILLDAHMVPKIADFGLSRCLGEEQTRAITENIIGTLGYADPQYLKTGEMEYASDIYSLGVIIMEILAGVRRYHTDESVVESWINLLRASEGDMQMEQVRVCYNIGIQCMDLDPKKRPVARHIVDMLDKTIDNSDETSIASSLWGGQHMKENINCHRTSNFRSTRKYFEFFIRKARRNFDRNNMLNLEKSYFISIFRKDELEPILRSSNFIGKGAFTEVYKGVIDNTLVAVKKTVNGKAHKNNELKNEVIIQSQISHKNIVLLIGCCLEMDTPVLVYEFLPGGSLHDILHRDSKVPLNLVMLGRKVYSWMITFYQRYQTLDCRG